MPPAPAPALDPESVEPDPIVQFRRWYADAEQADVRQPDAMTLATAALDGTVNVVRAESGKLMTSKGFGVGLSLAEQIVEAHGSAIEIEGAPGEGSRFSFLLPIAAPDAAPA